MPRNHTGIPRPQFLSQRQLGTGRRRTTTFLILLGVMVLLTVGVLAAPGDLDTSFNGTGKVTTPIGSGNEVASAVAIQADGKILAVGDTFGVTRDFALARYNVDGSLDSSFDGDGKLTTDFNNSFDTGNAVAVQSDGKIIVAGNSIDTSANFALVRYNPNGVLDTSFGGTGKITTDLFSGSSDTAYAVAVQPDGKIVAAGISDSSGGSHSLMALVRYNPDGSLDSSFGGTGKVTTTFDTFVNIASAVAVQSDGKIVAAGSSYSSSTGNFALARFNPNGSLDTTFDGDGKVSTDFGGTTDRAYDVALQADGKLVIAGYASSGSSHFALARYNSDGSLDSSFGGTGKVTTDFGGIEDGAYGVAVQPDSKIVAAGYTSDGPGSSFALARYNPNGTLDASFGGTGKVKIDFSNNQGAAQAVAIQPDGKIVAAGNAYNGANVDFALVRLLSAEMPAGVQFSQTAYSIGEGQSFATITVTRGDTSGAATIKYVTSDSTNVNFQCDPSTAGQATGVASRKCDYHIAAGRLRFAPGESSKQIVLSLVNDVYVEGSETLTIALSDPTGATLGQNSVAAVTITDNDIAGTPNPIDGTAFYVRQLYVDLLSREPDPAGQQGWINRIDLCGQPGQPPPPCDRVTVGGDGFLRSAEFFDRQFFVIRLYRAGLGRIPRYDDVGDLAYVSGFLTDADLELNKQELVTEIMSRSEFGNLYNGLQNGPYVDALIQTVAVTIPQSVRDGWVTALNNATKTRAQVYRDLSERAEVSNRYLHEAQVVSCYYGFFTRNPDGAYFDFLDRLDRGEITLGDLANAFINASEYRQRFGQ